MLTTHRLDSKMCLRDMCDLAWVRYTDVRKADIWFSLTQVHDFTWNTSCICLCKARKQINNSARRSCVMQMSDRSSVNARSLMLYSEIAQKLTDECCMVVACSNHARDCHVCAQTLQQSTGRTPTVGHSLQHTLTQQDMLPQNQDYIMKAISN